MSRWKKISLAVILVVVFIVGVVGFLVGTTPGLHVLFSAANRWVPGLHIGNVEGGWRNLTLSQIRYEQPGVAVNAGRVHLSVSLRCLWHSKFCVNDLALKDINVAIDSSKMPPSVPAQEEESGPLNLSTPYAITLSRIAVENVNVSIDDTTVSLMAFHSGVNWEGRNLTITPTTLEGLLIAQPKTPQGAAKAVVEAKQAVTAGDKQRTGATQQVQEPPLGETLEKLFAKPLLPEMDHVTLPVNLTIAQFTGKQLRLTGDSDITVNKLLLKVTGTDGHLKLDTLDVDSSEGLVNASGQATLSADWPVDLTLNASLNTAPLKGEKIKLNLNGGLRSKLGLGLNLSGPVNLDVSGETQLAQAGLPVNLQVSSQQLAWPLEGAAQYQVHDLKLSVTGSMRNYQVSFASHVKGDQVPPAAITLNGKGTTQQFVLDKLRIAALEGNTDLTAVVDWSKAISWHSELTLAGINTAKQYPDWPSRVDGVVKTRGSLYGGTWQVSVPEIALKGNVKQNPLNIEGNLRGNSYMQWLIPKLNIALGRNTVAVQGEVGEKTLKLDASIDAPALDNALPGLGGTAKGLVKVRGDMAAPQLFASIQAHRLRWQALSVSSVNVDGDISSGEQIGGHLKVLVGNITQPGLAITRVALNAEGNENQHQMKLEISGEPVSGHLSLNGHFDRQQERWQGTLSNTRFDTPVGPWLLTQPVSLDYRNQEQRIAIGVHCWRNPNAELCVPQPIEAGHSGRARINLNRFDLAMLKDLLPEGTKASGVFSGNADVSWDSTKPGLPEATIHLAGKGVKVNQAMSNGHLPVEFDALTVNAAIHNDLAQADWLVRLVNNGQLDGKLQVKDPQGRRQLSGNVNLTNFSLDFLNPVFTAGEKANGKVNARLTLGGDAQKPQLFGQVRMSDLGLQANFMPFDMQPSDVTMAFTGQRSTLQGTVRTSKGQISLSGFADWAQLDNWKAQIAAKGSRVRITVPPMVRMDVSPDIVFDATPSVFMLNGSVDVPWARIVVHDLPESAVGVSDDEVMLNDNLQPVQPKTASIPINSNLKIHIGNNVRLNAFGLKARLDGDLKVVQDKQGLGLNGQINIPEGRFHAYGQDLIVRKGILLFSGPPDQPSLNIEAIRNPDATQDNVVAGVRVTGMADEPKAEIFSDPAMSQQEALSYLLRGQGLSSEQGDGAAMTSMLIGMGVAQSGQVVGKIGETFGVKNLSLDTTGAGDSSQVVVSGYVLPGLQVKYGVGIFDSLATLTLRYRLMPKLYLEAVSGVDQALDLLYQFEF